MIPEDEFVDYCRELVDEIGDVTEVSERQFEPCPDNLDATTRELVSGVYKLEKQLLLLLDIEKAAVPATAAAATAGKPRSLGSPTHSTSSSTVARSSCCSGRAIRSTTRSSPRSTSGTPGASP